MWHSIELFLESIFIGPMWPATVLLGALLAYLMLAVLGTVDLNLDGADLDLPDAPDANVALPDAPDADIDVDVGEGEVSSELASGQSTSEGLLGLGAMTLRWLNLGKVPVALWMGTFTVIYWCTSWFLWISVDTQRYPLTFLVVGLLIARNIVIAICGTKFATNPMVKWFTNHFRYHPGTLIGKTCRVSTGQATETFGQARFKTNAAPLLLNIRTVGKILHKGDLVRIVSFEPDHRIYVVTKENQQEET